MALKKRRDSDTFYRCADEWVITDISTYLFNENNERVCSEYLFIMSSESEIEDKWCLKLKFDGKNSWITIECNSGFKYGSIRATHSIYMIYNTKRLEFIGRTSGKYDKESCESVIYFMCRDTFREIVKKEQIKRDILVLCVELQIYRDNDPFPADYPIEVDVDQVPGYYQKLYFNRGKSSDVLIIVEKMRYPAHSHILKYRCPELFAKIHSESGRNKLVAIIPDMTREVIRKILQFIYFGEVVDFENCTIKLLEAADKLKLTTLKKMCEKFLSENYLTLENTEELLKLAEQFNAQDLETYIHLFKIVNNVIEE